MANKSIFAILFDDLIICNLLRSLKIYNSNLKHLLATIIEICSLYKDSFVCLSDSMFNTIFNKFLQLNRGWKLWVSSVSVFFEKIKDTGKSLTRSGKKREWKK